MANSLNIPAITIQTLTSGVVDVTPPAVVVPVTVAAPVNISDSTGNPITTTGGALNITGEVSIGNLTGKTDVVLNGFVPTSSPVPTVVLTYTVPANTTLYLQETQCQATGGTGSPGLFQVEMGAVGLYKAVVNTMFNPVGFSPAEPIAIPTGTVVTIRVFPNSATSINWYGNLIGFTKTPS